MSSASDRAAARAVLRESLGLSFQGTLDLVPEPGFSRDQLAAMAMQGLIARRSESTFDDPRFVAAMAYQLADAMLAARAARGD